jgi:signal transduction histidine kinase
MRVPMSSLQALRRAAQPRGRRPSWFDAGLVLVLLAIAIAHNRDGGVAGVVLHVALVVPLLWRRRAPMAVFCVIWGVAAVQGLTERPAFSDSALLIAFYTIASTCERRTMIEAGIALEIGIVLAVSTVATGTDAWAREFVALTGLATAAGVLGINVGNRRQILAALRERAERLEAERERELALATATERSRIAREMHDVIAHNLSVMVALCDGAGYHIRDAPERVASALEQASRTGRQALAEMRQLLGVLHEPPAEPQFAPQPGIRQIENLVEQVRVAGVPVTYTLTGQLSDAPPGMELAIYRIVQEALTNTMKHAGPGARATVTLTCADDAIEVEVTDTGMVTRGQTAGGAGLRGMRERAAVYGGWLEAGPGPEGGWRVRGSLGLPAPVPAQAEPEAPAEAYAEADAEADAEAVSTTTGAGG